MIYDYYSPFYYQRIRCFASEKVIARWEQHPTYKYYVNTYTRSWCYEYIDEEEE